MEAIIKILKKQTSQVYKKIKSLVLSRSYRPLIHRLGDTLPFHPALLFVILLALAFLLRNIKGINLTNSLAISYLIPYFIVFNRKIRAYLNKIKPSLEIGQEDFEQLNQKQGTYRFLTFVFVTLLSPLLVYAVNYSAPADIFYIEGQIYILGISMAKLHAIITGVFLLHLLYITITEVYRFNIIAKKYAVVDLLDLSKLDPFSHVAIAAGIGLIGLYIVLPISFFADPELRASMFNSLIISIPFLIITLTIPLWRLYREINARSKTEKSLIQSFFKGDLSNVDQLAISSKQQLSHLEMIQYRTYINGLSPVPITQHSIIRFCGSIVLLIISWTVPLLFT